MTRRAASPGNGSREFTGRRLASTLQPLALVFAIAGCGEHSDESFEDLVGSGIGTFGEPAQHECERRAEAACGSPTDDEACFEEELGSCATEYYLRGYAAQDLPDCDPMRPLLPISAELDVALFRGEGIRDDNVVPHTRGLQRYYEPHDLWMTAAGIAENVDLKYALSGSNAEFVRALNKAGIDPALEEDAATELIGRVMFAPTRDFLEAHALPAWAGVNVVVIGQILSPELARDMELDGTVVGLGLSATLLEKTEVEGEPSSSLNTMLDLTGDFTPSLFVGNDDIETLSGSFDLVIAHELGHALGLAHVEDGGNLMEQGGSQSCRRWLSESQIEEMGPFSDIVPPGTAITELLALPRQVARQLAGNQK